MFPISEIVTDYFIKMDNGHPETGISQISPDKIQVYPIRWLVLAIFVAYSASNAIQWTQFSIISDVVTKYYEIDATLVDWTSLVYMVLYIPLVFPASYIMEKLVSKNMKLFRYVMYNKINIK